MIEVTIQDKIDRPWDQLRPIRLGSIPKGLGTPNIFVTVYANSKPPIRLDMYADSDETHIFEEALFCYDFVTIEFGLHVYLVALMSHGIKTYVLGNYFSQLYPAKGFLLITSAEHMLRVERDGSVKWSTQRLGIDGVKIDCIEDGIIKGEGEWDPPGGWKPFKVRLESGSLLE
jgi:hypothetical protein